MARGSALRALRVMIAPWSLATMRLSGFVGRDPHLMVIVAAR